MVYHPNATLQHVLPRALAANMFLTACACTRALPYDSGSMYLLYLICVSRSHRSPHQPINAVRVRYRFVRQTCQERAIAALVKILSHDLPLVLSRSTMCNVGHQVYADADHRMIAEVR